MRKDGKDGKTGIRRQQLQDGRRERSETPI
jgi:hypothetical protein